MKPKVLILGAGGTGREISDFAQYEYEIVGFVDDKETGDNIICNFINVGNHLDGHMLCSGLGNYRRMKQRVQILSKFSLEKFITLVAVPTVIYKEVSIGCGSVIFPGSVISTNVVIGKHTLIYHNCIIAHDSHVGNFSILSNGVVVSGKVFIGRNTYVGAGATVIDGIQIGDNCIVAAGATVIESVPNNCIYYGPRKIVPNRFLDEN